MSTEEIFSWKVWFSTFLGPKELIIQWLEQYFSNYLLDPFKIVPWHLSCSILQEKLGHNIYSTGKFAFFFTKICVFNNLLGPKKCSHKFHSNCQNTFRTLQKCSLSFFVLDNIRKTVQLIFFTEKTTFFIKNCVFNNFISVTDMIS